MSWLVDTVSEIVVCRGLWITVSEIVVCRGLWITVSEIVACRGLWITVSEIVVCRIPHNNFINYITTYYFLEVDH